MLQSILADSQRYSRYKIGKDIEFVRDESGGSCWLFNKSKRAVYPLILGEKAVFCTMDDIDEKALAYIKSEDSDWRLDARYRFWVYESKKSKSFLFEWTVQPDGMYWMDEDGFGADNSVEIILRGRIDREGKVRNRIELLR